MLMDLKFAFKSACGWASHPWFRWIWLFLHQAGVNATIVIDRSKISFNNTWKGFEKKTLLLSSDVIACTFHSVAVFMNCAKMWQKEIHKLCLCCTVAVMDFKMLIWPEPCTTLKVTFKCPLYLCAFRVRKHGQPQTWMHRLNPWNLESGPIRTWRQQHRFLTLSARRQRWVALSPI